MKASILSGVTLLSLCVGFGATSTAQAGTYVTTETENHVLATYCKVYVPATVQHNDRGILVRRASVDWDINGNQWEKVRNPAVYIETTRVLEEDHYKLVSGACP